MTKVLEIVPAYTPRDGDMVHDGYFIVSNNYPLKWVEAWRWDDMATRPQFRTRLDRMLMSIGNA